jgi:hypothetical protein
LQQQQPTCEELRVFAKPQLMSKIIEHALMGVLRLMGTWTKAFTTT